MSSTPIGASAKAFAPASIGNAAVGFDNLGFSFDVIGDEVELETISAPKVEIAAITGTEEKLPLDAKLNTATVGLLQLIADLKLQFGFRVRIKKGIALGSGMGGSSASAVAAVVAANELLAEKLSTNQLVKYAALGEAAASGAPHADNAAPCLIGGLVACLPAGGEALAFQTVRVPLPKGIWCTVVHPHFKLETRIARAALKPELDLKTHVLQSGHLIGFLAGCYGQDISLLSAHLRDVVIEPQRAHLIPGFQEVKAAALSSRAFGCTIAGAGPSMFAWSENQGQAQEIQEKMQQAFKRNGLESGGWSQTLNLNGARIIK